MTLDILQQQLVSLKITFIDGENSELKYRGIDIADLAGKHSFLDVSYLLMNGRLPTKDESKKS